MRPHGIDYSVVVPVYNGQETIRELVHRIRQVFVGITEHYEVLLVDDASSDDSPTIASSLGEEDRRTRPLQLERNGGQHRAIVQGFNGSRGARVIVLDDDLQHPPEEIPRLIEALEQGHSVSIGRFQVKRHPLYRRVSSRIKRTVEHWIYRTPGRLYISGFLALDGGVARRLARKAPTNLYLPAEIYKMVPLEQIVNVDVRHESSRVGRSRYGIWRSVKFLFNLVRQGFR